MTISSIAIIGCGAGGTMALERAILNNRDTIVFTGAKKERKRSRGHWVRKVDNIPGYSNYTRTLNEVRDKTVEELAKGPFKEKLKVVDDSVTSIKKEDNIFIITDKAGTVYKAHYVVLATGIMDEQPHINGSIKPILPFANKQLINYCLLCDGHKSDGKNTVVIGHSEDAAKSALILMDRYKPLSLTILTNGQKETITEETRLKLQEKKIEVIKSPITAIDGNKKERILNGFTLSSGEQIKAELGYVSLGIRPNNQFAKDLGATLDARGLVEADATGETSVSNLYVIGDLRANSMKQIYTAWQHAVNAIQAIDRKIRNT